MKSRHGMFIGELAELFGLPTHVLRYWEEMGLLRPRRAPNGRRFYDARDMARVALITLGKDTGLSLEQIRRLLDHPADRAARRALYECHREKLNRRIEAARASLDAVEHALECDAEDFTTCPDLQAKVAARLPAGFGDRWGVAEGESGGEAPGRGEPPVWGERGPDGSPGAGLSGTGR